MTSGGALPNLKITRLLLRVAWLVMLSFWEAHSRAAVGNRDHWAFQPVRNIEVPAVSNASWVQTPIDNFILAKLQASALAPSPRADKRTFIRRASFDLIGLPPAPEEIERFISDESSNAYSNLIDRLLESPHYGERWGRHWLDVARYADNKGYVFFEEKNYPWAWTYRDYVVRAFNEDKPYNQFVLEQLAADQLRTSDDPRTLCALGFLTVGDHFSNNTHDILDDRIDVVCRGLLGLTVGCARCHDHKFDPITMADYYALYGVFRSCNEPMTPPVLAKIPAMKEESEHFELELMSRERELRKFVETKHREIVEGARHRIGEYLMAVYAQRNQPPTESFMIIADKGDLNPSVISRWRSYLDRAGSTDPIWGPWHEFAQRDETKFAELSPATHARLIESTNLNRLVAAAFAKEAPKSMKDVADRYDALLSAVEKHCNENSERLADPAEEELRHVLYGPDAPPDVPAQMDWGFLSLLPDRASQGEFQKLLKTFEECLMSTEAPARAMVLEDSATPYEPRIFVRGNPNRPGPTVPRRFVQLLDPQCRPFCRGSGRLELAQKIVDPENPLTARVLVNRVWAYHFGEGLVRTPSDFGTRSEAPSHRELLDWLAKEFIRSGWKMKDLHRLIMNSATYQQASITQDGNSISEKIDPENRLLSHMNRTRHDFETQRDALLAVSGKLDRTLGGPPADLAGPRRTLYGFVNRLDIPPVMATFDFPSPSASCPQRAHTTVPPQALYLMNNEFVAECAAAALRRPDILSLTSRPDRVERLYTICFSRLPSEVDLRKAEEFLGADSNEKIWQQYAQALLMANEFVFVD
jgi:hypothetical protein